MPVLPHDKYADLIQLNFTNEQFFLDYCKIHVNIKQN